MLPSHVGHSQTQQPFRESEEEKNKQVSLVPVERKPEFPEELETMSKELQEALQHNLHANQIRHFLLARTNKPAAARKVDTENPQSPPPSATDAISLSQALNQEMTDFPSQPIFERLNKHLQDLLNMLVSITDKEVLSTLEKNIETFNQILARKPQTNPDPIPAQLNKLDNLAKEIQMSIYTQKIMIPDSDKDALVRKLQALLDDLKKKLDQFSVEQISHLFAKVNNLEKIKDSLTKDFQNLLEKSITNLKEELDKNIEEKINSLTKPRDVKDFKTALLSYLTARVEPDVFLITLLEKEDYITWDNSTEEVVLLIIAQFFKIEDFTKWLDFANKVDQGIPTIASPNPERAVKIKKWFLDFIQKQALLTINTEYQVIVYRNVIVKRSITNIEDYLKIDSEFLSDFAEAVKTVNAINLFKSQWKTSFFSLADIKARYNHDIYVPPMPDTLMKLLEGICPYSGKKMSETHFLFPIPASFPGKQYAYRSFFDSVTYGYDGKGLGAAVLASDRIDNTPSNFLTEISTFAFDSQPAVFFEVIANYPDNGKWVLVYALPTAEIKPDYQNASMDEVFTSLTFYLAAKKNFPFSLWPPGSMEGSNLSEFKDYSIESTPVMLPEALLMVIKRNSPSPKHLVVRIL